MTAGSKHVFQFSFQFLLQFRFALSTLLGWSTGVSKHSKLIRSKIKPEPLTVLVKKAVLPNSSVVSSCSNQATKIHQEMTIYIV